MSNNLTKVKIVGTMDENEAKAFKVIQMYGIISDQLIVYLKRNGMDDPHPAKEFVLELIKVALEMNSVTGVYYWAIDANNAILPCVSEEYHEKDTTVKISNDYSDFYYNIVD